MSDERHQFTAFEDIPRLERTDESHYIWYYLNGGGGQEPWEEDSIIAVEEFAFVTEEAFNRLDSYDTSLPTAPRLGRVWKCQHPQNRDVEPRLATVVPGPPGEDCIIEWRKIIVTKRAARAAAAQIPFGTVTALRDMGQVAVKATDALKRLNLQLQFKVGERVKVVLRKAGRGDFGGDAVSRAVEGYVIAVHEDMDRVDVSLDTQGVVRVPYEWVAWREAGAGVIPPSAP